MRFYTYGKKENPKLLFFHAAITNPEMYHPVLKMLSSGYYIIAPEADAHSLKEKTEFTNVSNQVHKVELYLKRNGITKLDGLYGVSMGGAFALRFLADHKIPVKKTIIDAGITPYQFVSDQILNRMISKIVLLSDILMITVIRHASTTKLQSYPICQNYSVNTIDHMIRIMKHMSFQSGIRVFDGTNNYRMPDSLDIHRSDIQYWYGTLEKKERKANIQFVRKLVPGITLREFPKMQHAELILEHPKKATKEIQAFVSGLK